MIVLGVCKNNYGGSMRRLILIDGSSLLSSSFFGTLDSRYHRAKTDEEKQVYIDKLLKMPNGEFINGVYGMVKSYFAMIEKINPSHVAIAWDVSRDTFRKKLYEDYKGTRKDTLPALKSQFAMAQEVFGKLGVTQYFYDDFEADDIIGTLAEIFKSDIPVAIWTKDQDALQLIEDNVSVWLITSKAEEYDIDVYGGGSLSRCPKGTFEFNEEAFKEIYQINPIQLIDYKAIVGDTSDNIPGISGVGDKTALGLLKEFRTIEEIYHCFETDDVEDLKMLFKEIGIVSPLKKMMDEIAFEDILNELHRVMNVELLHPYVDVDFSLNLTKLTFLTYLEQAHLKDKKKFNFLLKELSKQEECHKVISKIGKFKSGKAKDMAILSKKLATIVRNIPELNGVTLDSFIYVSDVEKRNQLMKEYGFKSLLI